MKVPKIAYWAVVKIWGNERVALVKYPERAVAEEIRERLGRDDYYVNLVKESVTELPGQVAMVIGSQRVIREVYEKNGERRSWTKTFNDVEVYTLHGGKYLVLDKFTSHWHRGQLRAVGFPDWESFEAHVRQKWPVGWQEIMLKATD